MQLISAFVFCIAAASALLPSLDARPTPIFGELAVGGLIGAAVTGGGVAIHHVHKKNKAQKEAAEGDEGDERAVEKESWWSRIKKKHAEHKLKRKERKAQRKADKEEKQRMQKQDEEA